MGMKDKSIRAFTNANALMSATPIRAKGGNLGSRMCKARKLTHKASPVRIIRNADYLASASLNAPTEQRADYAATKREYVPKVAFESWF